jgi:hypothetical protein
MSEQSSDRLPRRRVAKRYGVDVRTIRRWESDPDMGFPQPIEINGRGYTSESELTTFDRSRVRTLASEK